MGDADFWSYLYADNIVTEARAGIRRYLSLDLRAFIVIVNENQCLLFGCREPDIFAGSLAQSNSTFKAQQGVVHTDWQGLHRIYFAAIVGV